MNAFDSLFPDAPAPSAAPDYDYAGYTAKYGTPDQSGGQHLTDEFKLPNHMTFSTDSKYSNPSQQGGMWSKDTGGTWHFAPSQFNLSQHSPAEMQDYFKKTEPNAVLDLPTAKANAFDDLFPDAKQNAAPGAFVRAMTPEEMNAMQPQVQRGTSIMDKIDAAVRGAADTATFGMADRIAAGLGALTGIGGTQGDYAANLARERGVNQFDIANNPAPRIAGQLAGGLVVPGAAAAGGATLAERMGRGALAGAGQGALYGAGSSEDLTNLPEVGANAATGAAFGGALGGAAPPLVEGMFNLGRFAGQRSGFSPFVGGVLNPEKEAATRVAQALTRDQGAGQGLTEPAMQAAQAGGQPTIVADLGGQAMQALARSAANTSPEARQALLTATNARFESQSPRIAEFVSDLSGGGKAAETLDAIKDESRRWNRPLYAKAYADGANGVWNDQLASLMGAPAVQDAVRGAIKTGANRDVADGFRPVRSPFETAPDGTISPRVNPDGSTAIPSLQFWDHVKRNLDDTVGRLQRSGENSAARDAIDLRSQLVTNLTNEVPSYGAARGVAAAFFGAKDAVEAGAKFASAKGNNDAYRPILAKMQPHERELFAHGFASKLADTINEVRDRRSTLNAVFASPASRERVTMAMGPARAAKLENYLNVEAAMDAVRQGVQGNSTTARQLAELGMAGGVGGGVSYFSGQGVTPGAVFGALALHGAFKIDARVARHVGEMLASSDTGTYKQGLAAVAKSQRLSEFVKSISPRLVSSILPQVIGQGGQSRTGSSPSQTPAAPNQALAVPINYPASP